METKSALVVAFAREMIVDTRRSGRGGAVVSTLLRVALRRCNGRGWRLALPGGPRCNLGIDARQNTVQGPDAEKQQLLRRGHHRGEMHLQMAVRSVWICTASSCNPNSGRCFYYRVWKVIS